MLARSLTRAAVAAMALALAFAGVASADTAPGDADLAAPDPQSSRNLGTVAPGATVLADIGFILTCGWLAHVDHGQTVTFSLGTTTKPADGAVAATNGTIGPVPDSWPVDGEGCASPAPTLATATPSHVTLTAPTVPGLHTFTLFYDRSVAPAGSNDAGALTSITAVDLVVTVDDVTAPPPPPPPPPAPVPGPSVTFLPPLADGDLTVPRWVRTLPVKFRLDPAPSTAPTLALVALATCDAGAAPLADRTVAVREVGKSGAWIGHADLRGLGGACARLDVRVDGDTVGSTRVSVRP
jgi:hypothetical protein